MDLTTDWQSQGNIRKSLARRVSFASNAYVRLIDPRNVDNTNSTASPQSSPVAPSDPPQPTPGDPVVLSDENAYPGGAPKNRRRSSMRQSIGSEDMELTVNFQFSQENESTFDDEDMVMDDDDSMDMDMTQALDDNYIKTRALSLGGSRTPLSQISLTPAASSGTTDADQSQSFAEDQSQSFASEPSQEPPTEFTIPLNRSLRPPAHEDETWMALRRMTHSGDAPYEESPASDDEYVPVRPQDGDWALAGPSQVQFQDDTFSSTDASLEDVDSGDRTVNLSRVLGRPSFAGSELRMSMGQPDSTMDESEIYGSIIPPPIQSSTPLPARAAPNVAVPSSPPASEQPSRPPIFRPPSPKVATSAPTLIVAPPPKPAAQIEGTRRVSLAPISLQKRPRDPGSPEKVSPAKRQAVVRTPSPSKKSAQSDIPRPKPLSPSKKAPFLVSTKLPSNKATTPVAARPSALRRPSGYFARRKSVGTVFSSAGATEHAGPPKSPKKKAAIGLGRASMGSAPAVSWTRPVVDKGKQKEQAPESEHAAGCAREVERQAAASPTPSRGSPAPSSPRRIARFEPFVEEVAPAEDDPQPDPTEQWRERVQEAGPPEEVELPHLSLEQFFELTGIKFMDDIEGPRRSTHQPVRQARPTAEILLSEYAIAMLITVPELTLYSSVSSDLTAWIEQSKTLFSQAQEEAAKYAPELFTEYLRADEEGQTELLHQLNLIRINCRGRAKQEWYDWKQQWIQGLRAEVDKGSAAVDEDNAALSTLEDLPDTVLPALEQEYERVMKQLEKEQAEVAEIEDSDQDYLAELKASVAEQNAEVEAFQAELAESDSQLQWLQERLEELDLEQRQARSAIADANRMLHLQRNSTRAELVRLKEEVLTMQELHMISITKVTSNVFEYDYAAQFHVTVPCRKLVPVASKVQISRLPHSTSYPDDFPSLSRYFLETAHRRIHSSRAETTSQVMGNLSDYWSACGQVRTQLFQLTIKYPVDVEFLANGDGFKARTTVLFPAAKAKAYIDFIFPVKTFSQWPISIEFLEHDVTVAYGAIERDLIFNAVSERMELASAAENYGCLLDACIGVQDLYQ
ncbi:unnamed protein product [Mycena citricolor]|uniref:Spc7 kinetochore protein domain-containing protein n=1 Tax=Mycena citricolor TaxID=2018698 RepID=A0AAD2GVH2_9AGAR|nr:unnamed protein product [Mycena citricolor]